MDLKLEVLISTSIRRRKPWPRFCWLGREKEGVFLLDDNRISEIHLISGRTKKKIPKLQPLLQAVVTMSPSQNGMWLGGLLLSGGLFLWNKDNDFLKMISTVPDVQQLVSSIKGSESAVHLSLQVSDDARRLFLANVMGQVFLWECTAPLELNTPQDGKIPGRWSHISSPENIQLPNSTDKEACAHSVFAKNQAVGDVCLGAFVFTVDAQIVVTMLKIQWDETWDSKVSLLGFRVLWVSECFPLGELKPPCKPLKSRGALVPAFSPDGQLLALVLNQRDPWATQSLFISTQNFVTVCSLLGGCGLKVPKVPAKYARSYWVSCISWSSDGLYLACVLKRGSLLLIARLAGLVSLSTTGSSLEFSSAHFLPLHPLITCRPAVSLQSDDAGHSSSSVSLRDPLRQRFSVCWHAHHPLLLVSDGYMVTLLKTHEHPSAATLMSSMLMETVQILENTRHRLSDAQPQARCWLESMSSLTLTDTLQALRERQVETSLCSLPLFLLETGENQRALDEEDVDSDDEPCGSSYTHDRGTLEFASMFDTLHAQSAVILSEAHTLSSSSGLVEELERAHQSLVKVWALGVSLGCQIHLLRFTLLCFTRLLTLLRLVRDSWVTQTVRTIRTLLQFLPWDAGRSTGLSCLGILVELARAIVELFLPLSSSDSVCSSQNFIMALSVLQEVSQSLDRVYTLPSRTLPHEEDEQLMYTSDMFSVPVLQEDTAAAMRTKPAPSSRLLLIWREVYRQALWYLDELHNSRPQGAVKSELENMSAIIPQIQEALQLAGDHLEESHALRSFIGEEYFICGEYSKSVRVWWETLQGGRVRGQLGCVQETRCCLSLLFSLLCQYRLREALALCDSLARKLQPQTGDKDKQTPEDAFVLEGAASAEASYAVVQSLARFMAAYFTNKPLYILPPHHVDVLPPLHLPQDGPGRFLELCRDQLTLSVRSQQLSVLWTVDYALDLLMLGGLIPEAVWMAHQLGDWKMSATVSLAYTSFCGEHPRISSLRWRELYLTPELKPSRIFQERLEMLMNTEIQTDQDSSTGALDSLDPLQVSLLEILKASVMAEVDVLSHTLTHLTDAAKERAMSFPAFLPAAYYLPAPPLYCPQPSPNTQDLGADAAVVQERESRSGVSVLLQKFLLLLRASRCTLPAAQWYISHLQRCRKLLHKVQKKGYGPEAEILPEGLKKLSSHRGFFQSAASKDMDGVTLQVILCFRELCALCWMLHVRDQLSISCRKFQNARKQQQNTQVYDASLWGLCVEAVCWARRLLPFCHFLNAEEALQDLLLSLLSELPASHMTAEILKQVFPEESESVRVPLQAKHSSLLQRLRAESERLMMRPDEQSVLEPLLQNQHHQHLRHLERSFGAPIESFLWEKEREVQDKCDHSSLSSLQRLSLATSVSEGTLSRSDLETPQTLSGSPELKNRSIHSSKSAMPHRAAKNITDDHPGSRRKTPVVGTWEFELEDEEFLLFLQLFLSYVLEKDGLEAEESDPPLLSSFSQHLHSRELYSPAFDMMTALKRRQKDGHRANTRLPVFRAGHCFQMVKETPEPPILPAPSDSHAAASDATTWTLPGLRAGKQQGLFSRPHSHSPSMGGVSSFGTNLRIRADSELEVQTELDSSLELRHPRLARLLEWMLRWADRRFPMPESCGALVMRVRGSSPALLSALEQLEGRYSATLLEENTVASCSELLRGQEDWLISDQKEKKIIVISGAATHTSEAEDGDTSDDDVTDMSLANQSRANRDQVLTLADLEGDLDAEDLSAQSQLGNSGSGNVQHIGVMSSIVVQEQMEKKGISDRGNVTTPIVIPMASESVHSEVTSPMVIPVGPEGNDSSVYEEVTSPMVIPVGPDGNNSSVCGEVTSPIVNPAASERNSGSVPEVQSDAVRRLMQDELFRLMQLQQINLVSLMQVFGASLANLPLSQAQQYQPTWMVPQNSAIPAQSQPQPNVISPKNSAISPQSQPLTRSIQDPEHNGANQPKRVSESEQVYNYQHRPNLPVNVNSKKEMEERNPPFKTQEIEQLTVPSDWQEEAQPNARFVPRSQGLLTTADNRGSLPAATPVTHGLRLLQLNPSHGSSLRARGPPLHSIPPTPLPPQSLPVMDAWSLNDSASSFQRAENYVRSFPPAWHHHHNHQRGMPRKAEEPTHLPLAPHRSSVAASAGLPLLRFHPDVYRPVTLPHIPQTPVTKPGSLGVTSTKEFPRIQLLHREPDPPGASLPFCPARDHTPRLIPLEELMKCVRPMAAETKLTLLKADPLLEEKSISRPSNKRRKRREKKNEDKPGVSFRPDDSIIPPEEPAEETAPEENDGYMLPLGEFGSELMGQSLLEAAYATSAELHAYASTQKKPPDIQDACTNTDTAEMALIDVVPVVPPDVFLSICCAKENSPEHPKNNSRPEPAAELRPEGRTFISVTDLTDNIQLENQLSPAPSSAQLHLLAASVVNPTPCFKVDPDPNDPPGPSVVFDPPGAPERKSHEALLGGDPLTLRVLSGIWAPPQPALMSRRQISAKLSEMDSQLLRLEKIADQMDRDLAGTRLLVKNVELERPSLVTNVELKAKANAHRCSPEVPSASPVQSGFGVKGDDERKKEEEEILSSSLLPLYSPPAGQLSPLLENTERALNESLCVSGLSDVQDILCDLLRDGALSRSALDLSRSDSRPEVKMVEERRDLRMWMRRKQRERVIEHRKQREERRERERRPFISSQTKKATSEDLVASRKRKEERDRLLLEEHHEQRARDACSLITEMLNTPTQSSINTPLTSEHRSRSRCSSMSQRIPSNSREGALGQTVVLQRKTVTRTQGSLSNRLGLHRPASALPGDRLSQVTRRGMLSASRPRHPNSSSQNKQKAGRQSSPERKGLEPGLAEDTETPVGDATTSCITSDELNRILMLEDPLFREHQGFAGELSDADLLRDLDLSLDVEALSPSSALSRLDWAAVERMVAGDADEPS